MSTAAPFQKTDPCPIEKPEQNGPEPASWFWPDYRTMWRWHFYAGLFFIPFIVILAISGAIYLFKAEIEAWNEWDYDHLTITASSRPAAEQIQSALAALPGSTFSSYEIPQSTTSAGRVIVRQNGESIRTYVHPETLEVLGHVNDSERLMRQVFRLHGELWMGDRGSNLVELSASWTIILILTGLVLWWPRNMRGLGGILYPRFHKGQRVLWRDLHSVTGIWVSFLVLFLLLSGLPWARFWGDYLKTVRTLTGTASARQDWSNRSDKTGTAVKNTRVGGHGGHDEHGPASAKKSMQKETPVDLSSLKNVLATVIPLNLPAPVVIAPPRAGKTEWSVKSMTANRPFRENLSVDGLTGEIRSRDGFRDKHWLDQMVAIGIAAHEGRLFGWPNQLLGLTAAMGLVMLSLSGAVLWWRRREQGVLGAPEALVSPTVSMSCLMLVALLGIYLPLFGMSLLIVLFVERTLLRRIPAVRKWLGLRPPRSATAT